MVRNVYLEGELGEVFTPHLQIDCNTTADVFKCLDANFPHFREYFNKKHEEGTFLHIDAAGSELECPEELLMEMDDGDITVTPLPAGAEGIAKVVVGAVLVVVGIINIASPWGMFLLAVGANLVMTGIMELMAPDPAQDKTETGDESYLFNGNQQNIVSGDPVPVLYGRLRIPGQPCGFEIMGDRTSYASLGQGVHGADGDMPVGAGISTTYSSANFHFK